MRRLESRRTADPLAIAIPLALGAAISPLLALAQVATLTGPRPVARGTAFAAGAAIPLLAVAALVLILGKAFELPSASDQVKGWLDIGFGVILLALVVWIQTRPPKPATDQPKAEPAPWRSLRLGVVVMLANFSTWALFIPAVKEIASSSEVSAGERAAIALLVVVITEALALIPLAMVALSPARAERVLKPLGAWLTRHSRTINVAILLVFAAVLLVRGVRAL